MAPITLEHVDERIKDVIQDLYEIQNNVLNYPRPETQQVLVRNVKQLNESLSELTKSSSAISTQIPPEIIEYVDQGRNPDIYTREFVELVQSSNQELKGKCAAFASFRDIFGEDIVKAMPELKDDVARILAGGPVEEAKKENGDMRGI